MIYPNNPEPYVSPNDFRNRYKFHVGRKVKFNEQAIAEGIYKDHMPVDEAAKVVMWVRDTRDTTHLRGTTGQWIMTDKVDEWLDAHWFEHVEDEYEHRVHPRSPYHPANLARSYGLEQLRSRY